MNPTSPLDQLKDIHLPDPVSMWPLAWPWWMLLLAIFIAVGLTLYLRKKNTWRRQALSKLKVISSENQLQCIQQCNRLLKQVSLFRFGNSCASLSGEKWLHFLDEKLKNNIFSTEFSAFAYALDKPAAAEEESIDVIKLKKAVELWIRKHTC